MNFRAAILSDLTVGGCIIKGSYYSENTVNKVYI